MIRLIELFCRVQASVPKTISKIGCKQEWFWQKGEQLYDRVLRVKHILIFLISTYFLLVLKLLHRWRCIWLFSHKLNMTLRNEKLFCFSLLSHQLYTEIHYIFLKSCHVNYFPRTKLTVITIWDTKKINVSWWIRWDIEHYGYCRAASNTSLMKLLKIHWKLSLDRQCYIRNCETNVMGFVIGVTGPDLGLKSADKPICKHRCVGRHIVCILNNSATPFYAELFWV